MKAPKTVRLHAGKSARSPGGLPQQSQSSQWDSIIKFLDSLMDRLLGNHVCATLFFLLSVSLNLIIISEYVVFHHGVPTFISICYLVYMPPPEHVSSDG